MGIFLKGTFNEYENFLKKNHLLNKRDIFKKGHLMNKGNFNKGSFNK